MTPKQDGKPQTPDKMLTDVELELMTILWRISEGSVKQVIDELPPGRDLAYTSVSTILRILEQKGFLLTRKEGRGHVYIPAIKKEEYEKRAVRDVVDKVFEGTPVTLVRQLLDTVSLTEKDLQEIREMLKKRGGK